MRNRLFSTLAATSLALLALAGCSSDDDPAADGVDPTTASTPSTDASEPVEVPSDLESQLPSDLPTDIPTEVNLGDECPEINQVLTEASATMTDMSEDPTAATGLFTQLAADLRAAAEQSNDDVAAAAERVAAVYETLGDSLTGSSVPDPAMITEMTDAATALQQACAG